jgi:hypothetical protein
MNFIVKLSKSKKPGIKKLYDFIYIVINRLTKYEYFISYRKNMSAEELAYLFNRHVIL